MAVFPDHLEPDERGLVAIGANLSPAVLLEAYAKGIFPWTGAQPIPWYSPDPRLILKPGAFRASKSLKKLARKGGYVVRYDTAFRQVVQACAGGARAEEYGTWITDNMVEAYDELHKRGFAHSVEVWDDTERLIGGLYGLSLGRAFFGESMFAAVSGSSKLALWDLCRRLERWDFDFIDCQQETAHLVSLGAVPVPRSAYLQALKVALERPTKAHRWTRHDVVQSLSHEFG